MASQATGDGTSKPSAEGRASPIHFQLDAAKEAAKAEEVAELQAEAEHSAQVKHDFEKMEVVNKGNVILSTFKAAEEKIKHREEERRRINYPDVSTKGLWMFMSSGNI